MLKKYRPNESESEHASVAVPSTKENGRAARVSEEDEDEREGYERGASLESHTGRAINADCRRR